MADLTNDPLTASPESLVQLRESVEDWLFRSQNALLSFARPDGSFSLDNKGDESSAGRTDRDGNKRYRLHPTCTARAYVGLLAANRSLARENSPPPKFVKMFLDFSSNGPLFELHAFQDLATKEPAHKSLNNFDIAHLSDHVLVNDFLVRFYVSQKSQIADKLFRYKEPWRPRLIGRIFAVLTDSTRKLGGRVLLEEENQKSGHFFVTLHCLRALAQLGVEYESIVKISAYAEQECIKQAFYSMRRARHEFDVLSLVFAFVIYCLYDRRVDKDLCIACAEAIAHAQLPNGAWSATHPIIRGKNREPWHITSHELALCLTWLYFQSQLPDAARSILLAVMQRYFQRWVIPTFTLVPKKNNESGNFSGWFDDHTIARGVVMGWATAIVCHFLGNYSLVLRDQINRKVIESLQIEASSQWFLIEDAAPESKRSLKWSKQQQGARGPRQARNLSSIWPDLPPLAWLPRWDKKTSRPEIAALIRDSWRDPSKQPKDPKIRCGHSISENIAEKVLTPIFLNSALRPNGKKCAGMLLGPPRTGKTTLVNTLAEILEWTRVTVPSSVFFDSGFDMMEAQANVVFRRLQYLTCCVIFFDEFEEFFRDRGKEDQKRAKSPTHDRTIAAFTTPAMLPRLQDLHNEGRCLIFLATNYPDKIDSAIRRPGRFDFLLPIGDSKFKRKKDDPPYLWNL